MGKDRKVNIPMCLASVLLFLTLISIHLTSGLYARYSVTGTGCDGARVIRFGELTIEETGDFLEDGKSMMITPGVDISKKADVHFDGSESATYVFAEVTLSDHWQKDNQRDFATAGTGLSWAVDGNWTPVAGSENVFYRELAPNTELTADIIQDNVIKVSDQITGSTLQNLNGLSIGFRASVVQSNGFDSAAAAWASLQAKEGAA